MFSALRNRNFALLWFGQLVSLLGSRTSGVAIAFYVLQLTGSVLQTGLMFILETLPGMLFGSMAGVFVDRWNRRTIMIVVNLLRAALLFLLLLVRSPHLIWIAYIVAFADSFVSLFFSPAVRSITPLIVGEEQLVNANALESLSDSVTRLIGPPLGGALLAFSGLTIVVLIDSTSFLFSVLTLLLIAAPHQQRYTDKAPEKVKNIWREWLAGLQVVRKNEILSAVFIVTAVTFLGQSFVSTMFIVFIERVLHGNSFVMGLMPMAQGIGALFGSFLITWVQKTVRPAYILGCCLAVIGAATLVFIHIPTLFLTLVMTALIGVFVVGSVITKQTLLQLNTSDSYRGRIFGAISTTESMTLIAGMLVATLFGDRLGAVFFLNWSGIFYMLAGLLAFITLRKASIL